MSVDVAKLGIEVDSRDAVKAGRDLDTFTKSGARAEKQALAVGEGSSRGAVGVAKLAKAASAFGIVAGAGLFGRNAIATARPFNAAIAEASTLIEGTSAELNFLTDASKAFVSQYGGTATQQVQAFYQAISAGAGTVEEAQVLLESANKLAQGGVTTVATGVDLLTTAVNAYAAEGLTAAEVSDALFVGIKGGKTNAEELGASLGNIVPLASAAGVAFDEVVAGVAALTTQGQTTSVAVTGLRQVIAGILKPTSEAEKLAAKLGIAFDAQGLKAKGLSGFLTDVIAKTGGSQEALAQLFGSVEALNAVLSIAGGGGIAFADILEDMEGKLGATDAAAAKIAASLEGRLNAAMGVFNNATLSAGQSLLPIYVAALEAGAAGLELFADNTDIVITGMVALTATQLPALISTLPRLATLLTSAATATRLFGTALAFAGGPLGILAAAVSAAATYFIAFRDNADKAAMGAYNAEAGTKALNDALRDFSDSKAPAAGKNAIALANNNLALADSAYQVADANLAQRKSMLELAQGAGLGGQSSIRDMGVSASQEAEKYAKAISDVEEAERALSAARNDQRRAVTSVTGATFTLTEPTTTSGTTPGAGTLSGLASDAAEASETFDDIFRERTADLEKQADMIGLNAAETARLRVEMELTDEVQRIVAERGFEISADERLRTEVQIALLGEKAAALVLEKEQTDELARGKEDLARLEEQRAQASERANFELGRGIGNAITQAGSLEDKLKGVLTQIISIAAESTLLGALTGQTGGGGFLGNVFSSIGAGIFGGGASTGGGFNSAVPTLAFAKGGVVNSPTNFMFGSGQRGLMGEAGPESIMPLARAANGDMGVRATGAASQSVHVTVDAGPEFDVRVQQSAGAQTSAMIGQNNKARDRGFTGRFKAADSEIRKDNR